MRWIEKSSTPPEDFIKWKRAGGWHASDRNHPTHTPKAEQLKHAVKTILLNEQGYICCYCEDRIQNDSSHIEHVKPKGRQEFASLVSEYDNLLCSCNTRQACGNVKDKFVIAVTPLDQICADSFSYSENGKIQGLSEAAEAVIQLLKLDSERLNRAREGVINELLWEDLSEVVTLVEFDTWIEGFLSPDSQGQLPRFWSATRQTALKYRSTFE